MAEYSGLRRFPAHDREASSQIEDDALLKYGDKLNSELSHFTNPYERWRTKRRIVGRDFAKSRPNHTQEQLDKVYTAMNLDSSSSPGDFNRDDGFFGSLSRAGSLAVNSAGSLVDVAQMKAAELMGDTEEVMTQQQQLDDSAVESGIIQRFEEQSGDGKNAVTQFLFDVAASAPIMVGIMAAGTGLGMAAGALGAPVWLAGLLGMGAVDALSEMGFNYADIVTDKDVRKKMEVALGGEGELNEASMEEIRIKVQELLMDEADSSAAKVGITNFMNPLNLSPVGGKFAKLMKAGKGRMNAIGRKAVGTGVRESIEEFGQSYGSQYTAAEAKMAGMERAGVQDVPELKASWKRAGYEALMGLAVGSPIGVVSGARDYSGYVSGKANIVEEGLSKGELRYKKPGDKDFKGKGPLRFITRREVDAGDAAHFKAFRDNLDARERKIVDEELEVMREGEDLFADKSSPEKLDLREKNAKAFKEYLDNPPLVVEETETTPEEGALEFEDLTVEKLYNQTLKRPEAIRTERENITLEVINDNPDASWSDINKLIGAVSRDRRTEAKAAPKKEDRFSKMGIDLMDFTLPPKKEGKFSKMRENITSAAFERENARRDAEAQNLPPTPAPIEQVGAVPDANVDAAVEATPAAPVPTMTEGILGKDASALEIEKVLKEYAQGRQLKYTDNEIHSLVLGEIKNLKLKNKGRIITTPGDKKGKKTTEYDISYDNRVNVIARMVNKLGLTVPDPTAAPVETVEATQAAVPGVVDEVVEEKPLIIRTKPNKQNFDSTNTALPQKVDDADVSQFINKVVVIETPLASDKRSYVRVEGSPDAQSKIDREKLGLREPTTATPLTSRILTNFRVIKFIGIEDGKIIFREVKGGMNQDLTVPNIPVKNVPVSQATAENALRHLQTLEEKSFIGIEEKGTGKNKFNAASSSYLTVYNNEELQESEQARGVIDRQNKISALEVEMESLEGEIEIAEMNADILQLKEELEDLLPEKVRSKTRLKEVEPSTKERPPLNILGRQQTTTNARIKNIQKVYDENDKILPPDEVNRTLDDIESTPTGGSVSAVDALLSDVDKGGVPAFISNNLKKIAKDNNVEILKSDTPTDLIERLRTKTGGVVFDRSNIDIYEDVEEVTTGKGKKKKTKSVRKLAMTLPVKLDVSNKRFSDILRLNGFDLIKTDGDGVVTLRLSDVVPNVRETKKFTDPILNPVTGADIEADIKTEKKEYGEDLGENITRVYDPGRKDESQLGEVVKTKKAEAKLEEARQAVAEEEDTREMDAEESSMPEELKNWKKSAREKMANYNSSMKGKAGIPTTKALEKLRGSLEGKAKDLSDTELLEYLWANEGTKKNGGTTGTPNIIVVGGKNKNKVGINDIEVTLKDKKDSAIYQPQWTTANAPFKKLADNYINKTPQPEAKKKLVPKSKAKPPVETPVVSTSIASPIISKEDLINTLPDADASKKNKGRWAKIVSNPENGFTDVSTWDATEYPGTSGFTTDIKKRLPGSEKGVPTKLTGLIRDRMRDWLIGRVQTEEDTDSLKAEMLDRFWPILTTQGRKDINEALVRKGSSGIPVAILKKKSKIGKPTTAEPTPTEQAPIKQGFISENALSAERYTPTKSPSVPDVWYIDPTEVGGIFMPYIKAGQLVEYESFADSVEQDFSLGFEVIRKGKQWYILKITGEGQRTTEEGKIDKIEVPAFMKDVLTREGKETFGKNKPIDQISYKIPSKELRDSKTTSEIYVSLNRKVDVLDELNKAHHDKKRIRYARIVPGNEESVEVYWVNEELVAEDKDGSQLRGFITFKSNELAQEFVQDIKDNNPDFNKIENHYEVDLINRHIVGGPEGLLNSVINEIKEEAILGNNFTTASIELFDPLSTDTDPALDAEPGEVVDSSPYELDPTPTPLWNPEEAVKSRDEEIKSLAADPNVLKRIADDPPEGTPPLGLEVIKKITDRFRTMFPGSADISIVTGKSPGFAGLYDSKRKRIYLIADEHFFEEDVVKTLWHEGMGHGIQSIITPEEFLELKQIIETSLPNRFQEELAIINSDKEYKTRSDEEKNSIAAEEVFADFAENLEGQNATVIDSITGWLRKVYNSFAKTLGLKQLDDPQTEADIRALLLETADAFRKPRAEGRSDVIVNVIPESVDTSLKRRTKEEAVFNRTDLPESALAPWLKLYSTTDEESPSGSWWHNIRRNLTSKIVDPLRNIKEDIGMEQYMVARLAKRSDGVLATILRYSGVKIDRTNVNGVMINETVLDSNVKGLFESLKPLGTDSERKRFFAWIAYNRANKLSKEGRENRFDADDIKKGLKFNEGDMKDASTGAMLKRSVVYEGVRKDVMDMNKSIIDFGIKMGLLQETAAKNFEKDFYVPFYRIIEEEIGKSKVGNTTDYNSLTGQTGVKKLKGSGKPIGDPFNNLLQNWLHIIDASLKNDAAFTTIRSALTIQDPMNSSQMLVEKALSNTARTLRVLESGKEKFYNVNNKLLYDSLASLGPETKFPGFKLMIGAKGLFTKIITNNPVFKVNNILRDTVSAAGTSDIGFNLYKNAVGGYKSLKDNEAQMLVSGGYIQFAHTRADDPNYAETLLNKELSSGYILNNPESDETFLSALKKARHMGRGVWDWYTRVGDKLENANRAGLFKSLIEKGKSQTEAAFESRDLMDFTLHGGADWVKLVTSLTPFANAMLQGKYKLGRAVINNPKPVAIVAGLVMLASLYEEMLFEDDEEYQARPDWDRDTYWWLKIPGTDTIFKLPKPHEFSMIGNLGWRALKLSEEENPEYSKALLGGVKAIVSREFGIVPLPQAIKPLLELGINKNLFFDRPIEPMGSQGRSPSLRYGQYTSETSILASQILEYSPIDKLKLSPFQLEHLINGYFSWGGEMALGLADMLTRAVGDFPERPARKLLDYPMARRLFKSSPIRNTKAGTVFYKRLKEMEQAVQDLNFARKLKDWDKAKELYERDKDLLKFSAFMRKKARSVNDFNTRIKEIKNDKDMGADEKAVMMDRLYQLRNILISKVVKTPAFR